MHSYSECLRPEKGPGGLTLQMKVFVHVAQGRNSALFNQGNVHWASAGVRDESVIERRDEIACTSLRHRDQPAVPTPTCRLCIFKGLLTSSSAQ